MDKAVPRQEVIGLDKISVEMDATVTEAVQTPGSSLDMPRAAAVDKTNAETKPGGTRNSKKIYIVGVAFVLLGATIAACIVGFLRFVPRETILTDNGIPWVYSKGDPGGSRPSEIMIVDAWAPWGPMFSNFSAEFNSSKARNLTAAEMTVAADYGVPHWSYGGNQQRYNPPSNQGTNLYDYLCRNGGCDEDDKDPSESSEEERPPSPPEDDSSDSSEEDPSPPPPEEDSSDSSEEENPPPPPEDDSSDSSEEEHPPPHPEEDSSDSSEEEDPSPPPEDDSSDSSEEEHPPPRQQDPTLSDGHSASSESAHEASDGNSSGDASSDDHDTDVSFTAYHNMNCAHGIDNFYKMIEGTTREACTEKCSSNSLCSAYSYYVDTRTCKLRQNCSNMRSQHGVATGVKDRSPDDGDNTKDVSISKCQNKCTEDNRCGAYTYNLATNVCSLKKTCYLPRENGVHFSGIKKQSPPPPSSKPYVPSKPSPPKYDNKAAQAGQSPPPSAPPTAPKPASPSSQSQQKSPPPKQESPPPTPRQPPTPPPQPQWKPPAQSPPEPPGPQAPASPQMTWKKPFEEPAPTTPFIPTNKRACTASGCPDTNGWLEAHNSRRSQYHVEFGKSYVPLRWSPGLASLAKMYATELVENGCELEHCTDRRGSYTECPFGENLAFQRSGVWNGDSILERWVEDEMLFLGVDYRGGHATQALWRATNYLGCGHAEGECGMVQVCRYVRPGNCDAYSNWVSDTTGCGPDCPPEGCSNAAVAPFST